MVIDQSVVGSLAFLCKLQPFLALFDDLLALDVEMPLDDFLESLWRVLDLAHHRLSHVSQPNNVRVCFVLALSFFCALLALKSWLVEVDILAHGDSLGRDEELK